MSSCTRLCYDVTSYFQSPSARRTGRKGREDLNMLADATLSKPLDQAKEHPLELNGVLESRVFEKSPALRRLLLYLWEHRAEEINEYAIATEALDRREDFDPRTDAAVRVQIARLRQKLKEFYDEEGASSQWRITIPLGSYQVILDPVDKNSAETPFPIATKSTAPELSAETAEP